MPAAVPMLDALIAELRPRISGERALEDVRSIAGFHRIQATPGYDSCADWLVRQIERAGLRPEVREVPGDGRTRFLGHLMPRGWSCRTAVARLLGDGPPRTLCDFDRVPLSLIQRSAPARGRFPLRLGPKPHEPVPDGSLRGQVVLTAEDVQLTHERVVVGGAAAGLLSHGRRLVPPVRTADTDVDSIAYTSFWWGAQAVRGWGFVISPREGAYLMSRLAAGARLELEVEIDSRDFETRIPLVSAVDPAVPDHAEEIVIVSHLCHPLPGANDNASGAAANLEAARALARRAAGSPTRGQRRRIRHLWVPEFTGTYAWLATRTAGSAPVLAALNLDMVGENQNDCGSTFLIEHPPHFAASFAETLVDRVRDRTVDWVLSYSGPGHIPVPRLGEVPFGGGSDHAAFVDPAVGVPCPMLIQWPDRYYHSSYDTPDRCDPESLALAARCAAVYAAWLETAGEAETHALEGWIARRARRRLLAALDQDDAARATLLERDRARSAFASLHRLGRSETEGATRALDEFFAREIEPALKPSATGVTVGPAAPAVPVATDGAGRATSVPRRRFGAPLHYQRYLLAGWGQLTPEAQAAWRALESGSTSLAATFELAWSACDGRRTVAEIARCVWLEAGRDAAREISQFFEWTVEIGSADWV